jgi:VIT1/CCC1 family predicted Fe2+/Mn2+ transporter
MASADGIRVGLFFGTTSGVITTCGLLVGLAAGTGSLEAVMGGILVIAVADSMSDALGIHVSEESSPDATTEHVWTATIATFLAKLIVAVSFAVPFWFLPLQAATAAALGWGALLLVLLSWRLAKLQSVAALPVVMEHLFVGTLVITLSHAVGLWVNSQF